MYIFYKLILAYSKFLEIPKTYVPNLSVENRFPHILTLYEENMISPKLACVELYVEDRINYE